MHRIVWGSPTVRSKPAPDLFHAAVSRSVAARPSSSATRSGTRARPWRPVCPCVAVRTGGFCDNELLEQGAVAVYEDPGELLKAPEIFG